jgi:hypothetical protein
MLFRILFAAKTATTQARVPALQNEDLDFAAEGGCGP